MACVPAGIPNFKCLLFNPNSSCAATLRFRFGGICPRAFADRPPDPVRLAAPLNQRPHMRHHLEFNQGRRALVVTGLSGKLRPETRSRFAMDCALKTRRRPLVTHSRVDMEMD